MTTIEWQNEDEAAAATKQNKNWNEIDYEQDQSESVANTAAILLRCHLLVGFRFRLRYIDKMFNILTENYIETPVAVCIANDQR